MPRGYLYIWTEKEFIPDIFDLAEEWGFEYVDNVIWVKLDVNNKFVLEDCARNPFFAKSKVHLFIFRKDNDATRRLQIRHQRNADVIFDFIREDPREKPREYAYRVVETLVPSSLQEGKCLELFGKPDGKQRQGWTRICQASLEVQRDEMKGGL